MTDGMRRVVALVGAVIGFGALSIFGLGVVSVLTDAEVVSVPAAGQVPAAAGILVALAAFAGTAAAIIRSRRPRPGVSVLVVAAAAFLGYLLGVGGGVLVTTGAPGIAVGAVAHVTTAGFAPAVAVAACVAMLVGILFAGGRDRPRWPWETR